MPTVIERICSRVRRIRHHTIWTAVVMFLVAAYGTVTLAMTAPEQSTAEFAMSAVRDVGFPMVVAGFLLVRVDRTMSELSDAVQELKDVLTKVLNRER